MGIFFGQGLTVKKSGGWWKGVLKYILGVGLLTLMVGSNWTTLNNHFRNDPQLMPFIYAATDTLPHPGSLFFRPSTTMAVLRDLGKYAGGAGLP